MKLLVIVGIFEGNWHHSSFTWSTLTLSLCQLGWNLRSGLGWISNCVAELISGYNRTSTQGSTMDNNLNYFSRFNCSNNYFWLLPVKFDFMYAVSLSTVRYKQNLISNLTSIFKNLSKNIKTYSLGCCDSVSTHYGHFRRLLSIDYFLSLLLYY